MLGNMDGQEVIRSVGVTEQTSETYGYAAGSSLAKEYDAVEIVYDKIATQSKDYGAMIVNSPYGPIVSAVDLDQADFTKKYKKVATKIKIKNSSTGVDKVLSYYYVPKAETKEVVTWNNLTEKSINGTLKAIPIADPNEYQWNLPPHKWSLPYFSTNDPNSAPPGFSKNTSDERYRRGRIWWRYSDENIKLITADSSIGAAVNDENRKYGFQFLWNPETFSTAVAVQMDATPNSNDRFLGTVGAFPATETISFNIRIDRTNDFACAKTALERPGQIEYAKASPNFLEKGDVARFVKFYQSSFSGLGRTNAITIPEKLIDLFQRGTLADIEFLYRAINGAGPGQGSFWKNPRGVNTADIGFLQPTLLNIDIGPLSYQGYVTNMSVTHIGFTQDMTPIRSDVSISLNLLATAGITSTYAEGQMGEQD